MSIKRKAAGRDSARTRKRIELSLSPASIETLHARPPRTASAWIDKLIAAELKREAREKRRRR